MTKWYLDCVDDGVACVAYWAELRWKHLALSYSGVLFDGATREHLFAIDAPRLEEDSLTWSAQPLQCDFDLRRRTPGCMETLIPGVLWNCVMPAADAVVHIGTRELRGTGYAECLELTLAPWQLPIDELRWGRFIGEAHSIVWIDWRGNVPLSVLLVDGSRREGTVEDATVTTGDLALRIERDTVLRDAPLSVTLATVPLLTALVPARLARAHERKWCGRGTLDRGSTTIDRGWAVHEIVRFV